MSRTALIQLATYSTGFCLFVKINACFFIRRRFRLILGSITSRCSGKEPALFPEGTAGRVRIPLLVLANQLTARRFLSGMYIISSVGIAARDGGRCGIDK